MKLATYRDGSRDGQLVVVSRDLSMAHYASGIATKLQQVLDDWNFLSPQLQEVSQSLHHGRARHAFPFDPRQCMAPLPRAYQWAVRTADPADLGRSGPPGAGATTEGLSMDQFGSDDLAGPCDDIVCGGVDDGIDFEAGLAAITGDVALGASPDAAIDGVRLLMLASITSLRQRVPGGLAGSLPRHPATAFSPVAATPDELLAAWQAGRVRLNLESVWNGKPFGRVDAGVGMHFHFGQLIAHLCQTRRVRAGSIVGSGALIDLGGSQGFSCIVEKRAAEAREHGAPDTDFMRFGDTLRIDMTGVDGQTVFGAIARTVVPLAVEGSP